MMDDLRIVEITNDDLEVTERWLVKVSVIRDVKDEERKDIGADEYVNKLIVIELIQRFAPDDEIVLGFELSKLPVIHLDKTQQLILERIGDLRLYSNERSSNG